MSDQLPILDCNECGVCCLEITAPPFLGHEVYDLPEHLRDEVLDKGYDSFLSGGGKPCYWFDAESKKCSQYEHRPNTCRDFEVGSDSCLSYRRHFGLDQ